MAGEAGRHFWPSPQSPQQTAEQLPATGRDGGFSGSTLRTDPSSATAVYFRFGSRLFTGARGRPEGKDKSALRNGFARSPLSNLLAAPSSVSPLLSPDDRPGATAPERDAAAVESASPWNCLQPGLVFFVIAASAYYDCTTARRAVLDARRAHF